MAQKGDIRRHGRTARTDRVELTWKDQQGHPHTARGLVVDVSEAGMRVEIPSPLEKQSYVSVRSDTLGIHGTASVRNCSRKGLKYVAGLEFSGGLSWKPKTRH